jgi:hypothetical protein
MTKAKQSRNRKADIKSFSRKPSRFTHPLKEIALRKASNPFNVFDWHKVSELIAPLLRENGRVVKLQPPKVSRLFFARWFVTLFASTDSVKDKALGECRIKLYLTVRIAVAVFKKNKPLDAFVEFTSVLILDEERVKEQVTTVRCVFCLPHE